MTLPVVDFLKKRHIILGEHYRRMQFQNAAIKVPYFELARKFFDLHFKTKESFEWNPDPFYEAEDSLEAAKKMEDEIEKEGTEEEKRTFAKAKEAFRSIIDDQQVHIEHNRLCVAKLMTELDTLERDFIHPALDKEDALNKEVEEWRSAVQGGGGKSAGMEGEGGAGAGV